MACCIVFARLLLWLYRVLGVHRRANAHPKRRAIAANLPARVLTGLAAGEVLVVSALVWAISRLVPTSATTVHHDDMDMAGHARRSCGADCGQPGWYWAAAGLVALTAIGASIGLMESTAHRRAMLVLIGGAVAAAAVSPPTMRDAQLSHFIFMAQLEALAVIAPVLIILGIRPGWLDTAVSDAFSRIAPSAAAACAAAVVVLHLPAVHTAMVQSAVAQAIAVLAMVGTGGLLWLSVLGDVSPDTVRRRVVSVFVSQEAMAVVGLVLLLSPVALYPVHTSAGSTLTALIDQRAAGAVAIAVDLLVTVPVLFQLWAQARVPRPLPAR